MLLKDDDEFVSDDRLTKMALASVFYKKWMSETMAGKVFKEKCKLKSNLHSRQQTTTTSVEESSIHNDAFSVNTEALSKEISTIKWFALTIVALLFYDVFIKHQ